MAGFARSAAASPGASGENRVVRSIRGLGRVPCVASAALYLMVARAGFLLALLVAWLYGLVGIDQVREVVFGIADSIALAPTYQAEFRWSGWVQYFAFWLSAGLLGIATGHATRWQLSTGDDAVRAWPFRCAALQPCVATARRLLPGLAGLVAAAACHLVFVVEASSLLGDQTVARAAVLVAGSAVPWGAAAAVGRSRFGSRWLGRLGAAVLVSLAVAWCWLVIGSLGPELKAAVTISVVTSVVIAGAVLSPGAGRDSGRRPTVFRRCALATVVALYVALWTPLASQSWRVGSLPIVLVTLAVLTYALGAFVALTRRVEQPVAAIATAAIASLAVASLWFDGEPLGRETLEMAATPRAVATTVLQPADDRAGNAGVAIHADGGGIRAALFTASVLALADDMSCGEFGRRLRVASGVSGGSVGIAAWAVMREAYVRERSAWTSCVPDRTLPTQPGILRGFEALPEDRYPLAMRVRYMLAQDHLSPIVAAFVTRDLLPDWWAASAARGKALVDSWQDAARQVVRSRGDEDAEPPVAFAEALTAVSAGLARPPILAFSATNARTGRPVVFTNASWRPTRLPIGIAALHSARFPIVSPAGLLSDGTRVVDGGYYDNSGATTLDLLLREGAGRNDPGGGPLLPGTMAIVRIDGNPVGNEALDCRQRMLERAAGLLRAAIVESPATRTLSERRLAEIARSLDDLQASRAKAIAKADGSWTGLAALDAARAAHADLAAEDLLRVHGAGRGPSRHVIRLSYSGVSSDDCKASSADDCEAQRQFVCDAWARQAPLGWHVTQLSAGAMQWSEARGALDLLEAAGLAND